MDKYYEEQFMKKDQSLRIPEKANMQEYSERLEAIVKRWGVKKSFFLQRGGLSDNILVMFGFALVKHDKHDRHTALKYGFIKPTWGRFYVNEPSGRRYPSMGPYRFCRLLRSRRNGQVL